MNEMSFFQWMMLSFGGGVVLSGAGALIFLGRKIQELKSLQDEFRGVKEEIVLREHCKERHKMVDERFKTGDTKFTELAKMIIAIKEAVARIDERTAQWHP